VGSVAGAIAGIVILAMFIAFLLRRWRRRQRDLDSNFNSPDFVSPDADYTSPTNRASTFDPSPPNMAQLHGHGPSPSISSGPGMAGHGAYSYGAAAGPTQVYGNQYDHEEGSDLAVGGPYSSQPQPQAPYNSEAYGSYAHAPAEGGHAFAYSNDGAPALVPGAHAVAANRGTRSVNNEDAYGGY